MRASQLLAGHTTQNDFMHAETLSHVFKPLVELPDRHLLASAVGLTLALITGCTDLCSAGVFGAGKTRAAAAVIVGLIAIDFDCDSVTLHRWPFGQRPLFAPHETQ